MGVPDQLTPPARLESVDAFRGFVMLLMMAEILKLALVAKAVDNPVLAVLSHHQQHVERVGCSLHDLIQPGFSFLVGVSLPYSLAARRARGQSRLRMTLHAFWRAFVLVWLGIILRSLWRTTPDYGFTDTLSQIGLGYGFLFVLGFRPVRDQWLAFGAILAGYWAFFAAWPAPGPGFDWAAVGVKPEWLSQNGLDGFAAHWSKNANAAAAFDRWFLNLFPREPKETPFVFSGGGYQVLNFVPTLATMILGLIAGGVIKSDRSAGAKLLWLTTAGVVGLAAGYALGYFGVCPVVKRIWTPSWVLFSGGWCLLLLAGFYAVIDLGGLRRWAFPLAVVGMNSIAAYCIAVSFVKPELHKMVKRHLGAGTFEVLGPQYTPLLHGAVTLLVMWLILYWMYRRKVFVRV
jgi:heparan-alpha-glucosaminide N-acetyltransferase